MSDQVDTNSRVWRDWFVHMKSTVGFVDLTEEEVEALEGFIGRLDNGQLTESERAMIAELASSERK